MTVVLQINQSDIFCRTVGTDVIFYAIHHDFFDVVIKYFKSQSDQWTLGKINISQIYLCIEKNISNLYDILSWRDVLEWNQTWIWIVNLSWLETRFFKQQIQNEINTWGLIWTLCLSTCHISFSLLFAFLDVLSPHTYQINSSSCTPYYCMLILDIDL